MDKLLTFDSIKHILENSTNKVRIKSYLKGECFSCDEIKEIKIYRYISKDSKK